MMREPSFWWTAPGTASRLLQPLAAVYGAIAAARLRRPGRIFSIPVVCVGNWTLGGTGKTPAAIAIARLLREMGEQPFFLSRGYGGALAGPLRVEPGQHRAHEVGDEPLLLARHAPTIVARDRVAGAAMAIVHGASVIVMDDGLQNPSVAKNLAIAVLDGRRGIGNGGVFPAGPLRAPLAAQMEKSDALLVVGAPRPEIAPLIESMRTRKRAVLQATLAPSPDALQALAGQDVLAFAGIGDPDKFFTTLKAAGIAVRATQRFPDHHRYTVRDAVRILTRCDHDGLVPVTTEKDLVRLAGEEGQSLAALRRRASALPVTLVFDQPDDIATLLRDMLRASRA
jgi:tetraacyldisaccharide 4'-kinase